MRVYLKILIIELFYLFFFISLGCISGSSIGVTLTTLSWMAFRLWLFYFSHSLLLLFSYGRRLPHSSLLYPVIRSFEERLNVSSSDLFISSRFFSSLIVIDTRDTKSALVIGLHLMEALRQDELYELLALALKERELGISRQKNHLLFSIAPLYFLPYLIRRVGGEFGNFLEIVFLPYMIILDWLENLYVYDDKIMRDVKSLIISTGNEGRLERALNKMENINKNVQLNRLGDFLLPKLHIVSRKRDDFVAQIINWKSE